MGWADSYVARLASGTDKVNDGQLCTAQRWRQDAALSNKPDDHDGS